MATRKSHRSLAGKRKRKTPTPNQNRSGRPRLPTSAEQPRKATRYERCLVFVDAFLKTLNATKSALACGYKESNAREQGSLMLADPRVQELLSRHNLEAMASTSVTHGEVVQAIKEIAFLDPGECWWLSIHPKTGVMTLALRDLPLMPLHVRRAISSFKVIKRNMVAGDGKMDVVIEVKFWNKNEALSLLAQYKGMIRQQQAADAAVTQAQIEKLSDEDLALRHAEALEVWNRHLLARRRAQLALPPQSPSTEGV